MSATWRRWLPGPKHGIARGVAVYRSAGREDDDARVAMAHTLAHCVRLRGWAEATGVVLDDSPASLSELDHRLTDGGSAPEFRRLRMDLGLYLGTVIVTNVAGAQWHAWPNDHPVVRLKGGTEFDVVALANQAASDQTTTLLAIYQQAASR